VALFGYTTASFESLCFSLLGTFVLVNESPHFVRFLCGSFIQLGREPGSDMTPQVIDLIGHAVTIFLGLLLLLRGRRFSAVLALLRKHIA
jgi:hypothetical protein